MKRVAVVVAVVCVAGLAQVGNAADLEAGWYANIRSANIYCYGPTGPYLRTGGSFPLEPGAYGPFEVTDLPYGNQYCRQVLVPADAHGVQPGTSVDLVLDPLFDGSEQIAYLSVWWETNYDPGQMRLQLVQRDNGVLLWEQDQPGTLSHSEQMAWDALAGNLMFRVVVVPEPACLVCLVAPMLATAIRLGMRRCGR